MLHVGLDLSRKRLDVHVLDDHGKLAEVTAVLPDRDGIRSLARRLAVSDGSVRAVIESMTGARFIHDELERCGWDVAIADAQRVKGLAPLACKTDKIDARVLAELSWRDLIPEVWLPTPEVRGERERSRWRQHLVRHRSALKSRIHQTLISFGHQCPVSDLFGVKGRRILDGLELPEPWKGSVDAAVALIDDIDGQITECDKELRRAGAGHPYVPLLMTIPGVGWTLASMIAAEIGDIGRFSSPKKLCGYTGLCPRVYQSGNKDRRGPIARNGPANLRWALVEAAVHAAKHPPFHDHYEATKKRIGKQRGTKVARIEVARKLTESIWYMLSRNQAFTPAGPVVSLAA